MVPKEKDASNISKFRTISLFSVEGEIFFAVLAKRLTVYMTNDGYIDTLVQKGGSRISMMPRTHQCNNIADQGGENKPLRSNSSLARPGKCLWLCSTCTHNESSAVLSCTGQNQENHQKLF